MNPLVSLIVTSYNHHRFLKKALDSVIAQTYQPIEVVVVDNTSMDESPEIIKTYADQYNWKYIFHQKNNGPAGARNSGIMASQGDFICFLDGDDFLDPNKVATQVEEFLCRPKIDAIYTGTKIINENDNLLQIVEAEPYTPEDFKALMYIRNIVPAPASLMFRRKIFDQGFRYNEQYTRCEDYDLMLRLMKQFNFYGLNQPLYYYRRHDNNLSNSHSLDKQIESEIISHIPFTEVEQAITDSTFPWERKNILLGQFLMKQKNYKEALKFFNRNNDDRSIWYMGNCSFLMRDYHSAIIHYQKINPSFPEVWNNQGVIYKLTGDLEKAKTCFEEAGRLNPNYSDPVRNLKALAGPEYFFTIFELRKNLTLYQKIT